MPLEIQENWTDYQPDKVEIDAMSKAYQGLKILGYKEKEINEILATIGTMYVKVYLHSKEFKKILGGALNGKEKGNKKKQAVNDN